LICEVEIAWPNSIIELAARARKDKQNAVHGERILHLFFVRGKLNSSYTEKLSPSATNKSGDPYAQTRGGGGTS
jgi:hypothetical protein